MKRFIIMGFSLILFAFFMMCACASDKIHEKKDTANLGAPTSEEGCKIMGISETNSGSLREHFYLNLKEVGCINEIEVWVRESYGKKRKALVKNPRVIFELPYPSDESVQNRVIDIIDALINNEDPDRQFFDNIRGRMCSLKAPVIKIGFFQNDILGEKFSPVKMDDGCTFYFVADFRVAPIEELAGVIFNKVKCGG